MEVGKTTNSGWSGEVLRLVWGTPLWYVSLFRRNLQGQRGPRRRRGAAALRLFSSDGRMGDLIDDAGSKGGVLHTRFGEWLLDRKMLDDAQIAAALEDQHQNGGRLGEVLRRLQILPEDQVTLALAEYLRIQRWSVDSLSGINMEVAQSLPERIAKRFRLIVLGMADGTVQVAMADPLDVVAQDTVAQLFSREVKTAIATEREIRDAIDAIYHGSKAQEQRIRDLVGDIVSAAEPEDGHDGELSDGADISSELAANKAPVVRFVDLMLNQAVKSRASDSMGSVHVVGSLAAFGCSRVHTEIQRLQHIRNRRALRTRAKPRSPRPRAPGAGIS